MRIENSREGFLSHEGLARPATALDHGEDQHAAGIIRMCMLTGARVGEVRSARFVHVWMPPSLQVVSERLKHVIGCSHVSGLSLRR